MPTKVLIVDDENLIIVSTQMVLETIGYEVVTALDGEEALEKAKQESPDLILLDIMMPGMDGWETLKRLKDDPRSAPIPVIVFTAREHSKGRQRSLEMGAVEYFRKPFEPDDLIELVEQHTAAPVDALIA